MTLQTPRSSKFFPEPDVEVPIIDSEEPFGDVVSKLSTYLSKVVDTPLNYEQLRTTAASQTLRPLILSLSQDCHHPAIAAALLATRYQFCSVENEDTDLNESRALACELVAWQFLLSLSERELIDYLLYELEERRPHSPRSEQPSHGNRNGFIPGGDSASSEAAPLLESRSTDYNGLGPPRRATFDDGPQSDEPTQADSQSQDALTQAMIGMNALEIAAICDAKKFLSQRPVQSIIQGIWNGDIIFWDTLSVNAVKKARTYNKRVADPFTRLRVPKYQKMFQVLFFILFLALYYIVLVERNPEQVDVAEIFLYLCIIAFAYEEFGEVQDAGLLFYNSDFWSLWDLAIILVGAAFFVTRVVGLVKQSAYIIDISFDILSLIALFLVPRIFSIFSLNPYFGSLIPVLKGMTTEFMKFLPVIIVLYLGFLSTFAMLARDRLSLNEMSWILIKVFFGSSYLGFDVAVTISQILGYPLMLVFCVLTNILLLTALVSLVSNSLAEVMAHAREEYLFQYSIYVLESSTSNRLTYFIPPLNLVPLLLLRPLRLFFSSEDVRRIRIVVLKATHVPFVALIWVYEESKRFTAHRASTQLTKAPQSASRPLSSTQLSFDPGRDVRRSSLTRSLALNKTPLHGNGQPVNASTESASTAVDNTELIALVQSLALKVDSLTAMVAAQQHD